MSILDPLGRRDWWVPEAIPAATVIVLRDTTSGPELLLLRRDSRLAFAGGMWVFPGGRIDGDDRADGDDPEAAAARAAVREAAEEAGIILRPSQLRRWSHWTPPPETPKRFSTAFFVAEGSDDAVVIDDGEIRDHMWVQPGDALERQAGREVELTPPTFITLHQLLPYRSVDQILAAAESGAHAEHFSTRFGSLGDDFVALYHGDAGYATSDPTVTGPRHRLVMGERWVYLRD